MCESIRECAPPRELVFLATGECVREELRSVQIEIAADPLIYETDE